MKSIVISSGHGSQVPGASGFIDEVTEARLVVEKVAGILDRMGCDVTTFHDDWSTTQDENLNAIVDFHNALERDLDVSVHFNANETTDEPMGTECLYLSQADLAADIASSISLSGLINRGAKYRDGLYFLNNTDRPSVLIEVCFVDSAADVEIYKEKFDDICRLIAQALSGRDEVSSEPRVEVSGKASWFGGPDDMGVAPDEGLAFIYDIEDAPYLFLDDQPEGTTGLARRLDPEVFYIAMRWDYDLTPRDFLLNNLALVRAPKTGKAFPAYPSDWGPHIDTGRIADLSPGLLQSLGIQTDDEVEVIFPMPMRRRTDDV